MAEQLINEFTVNRPIEEAWPIITNVEKIAPCLPGAELQEVVHDGGGIRLLRIRIRERKRFTIFDVDPATARTWAAAMERWAATQPAADAGREP